MPALFNSFVIAAADASVTAADAGLAEQFGISPKYVIMQVVSFAILSFVLYRFAFKPVLATMDERTSKIESGLKYAEDMKQKLAETEKRQAEILSQAREEAAKIVAESRTEAKALYEKQVQETAAKVEDMLSKGRQANELERQKILGEVRQEVSRLVVLTTSRVLQSTLTDADRAKISEAAAKELASKN